MSLGSTGPMMPLAPERWPALDQAAKFASMGGGYRRAQFLASVLLGKAKRQAMIADIKKRHLKETVRRLACCRWQRERGVIKT